MIEKLKNKRGILIVLVLILLTVAGYFILRKQKPKTTSTTTTTPLKTPIPEISSPHFELSQIQKREYLEISGIKVDNFYKKSILTGDDGYSLFVKTSKYKIMYIPIDNSFLISIIDNPFDSVKPEAEEAFLNDLLITKEEACKLTVNITTPNSVNPAKSGQIYKLSFCE